MRWALLFLAACGGPFLIPNDAREFFPDAPFFGDPDAQVCTALCSGTCTDINNDPMNCGFCGHVCPSGQPVCVHGTCDLPGAVQFAVHFGGADLGNSVTGVSVDQSGNVYVTGAFIGTVDLGGGPLTSTGASDIFVASYTAAGAHRWSKSFGSTGIDAGVAIAAPDYVYVATNFTGSFAASGVTLTSVGGTDIGVIEFEPTSGDVISAFSYGSAGEDLVYGIASAGSARFALGGTFGAGTLDLHGTTVSGSGAQNGFVGEFDFSGNSAWSHALGGNGTSAVRAVAMDLSGNVAFAGSFSGTADLGFGPVASAGGSDAFVASYLQFGSPAFARTFGGADDDVANAVTIDQLGHVYAGGSFHGAIDFGTGSIPSTGSRDGFFVGYSATGGFQIARHLGAATSSSVTGLGVVSDGTVIVTGQLEGAVDLGTGPLAPLGQTDAFVAGFGGLSASFAKRLGGADLDTGTALGVGPTGVAIGGQFRGAADLGTGPIAGGAKDNGFLVVISP